MSRPRATSRDASATAPRRGLGSLGLALGFAALLAALSLVVWRQSRALESLRALEAVTSERDLAEAERFELLRRIQHLESRSRIEPYANERLGLHVPTGSGELVLLRIDQGRENDKDADAEDADADADDADDDAEADHDEGDLVGRTGPDADGRAASPDAEVEL